MSVSGEQDDYIFRPQQHLDPKWLNPDLQEALHSADSLSTLFNSIIQDREIYFDAGNGLVNSAGITAKLGDSGKYYCGLRILTCTCCDGLCGPHSGCACQPCTTLSAEEELRVSIQSKNVAPPSSVQVIDEIKWKQEPGPECLRNLKESLLWEQRVRSINTASTCPYISNIRRLIVICNRHLVAVIRDQSHQKEPKKIKLDKKAHGASNRALSNVVTSLNKPIGLGADTQEESDENVDESESALARVGARAALRLALSLVRRAWRCGEDADVCTLLLRDALEAVRALPDAGLYAGYGQSPTSQQPPRSQKIWAEVVDSDWRTSLCVWVELCARRAELPALLKAADVLVSLPQKQKRQADNRIVLEDCTAPMGPFLRRLAKLSPPSSIINSEPLTEDNHTAMYLKIGTRSCFDRCRSYRIGKLERLEGKVISQVACHPLGRHYLCRSSCGGVWSWGSGEDGRLGHGDTASRDAPQAGRLGHGTIENCLTPQPVSFNAHNIERWGDGQTLCCTWEGAVQVFGDSEGGATAARTLTALAMLRVMRVYTGDGWHAALTDRERLPLVWSLLGGGELRDALRNALHADTTDAYTHLQLDDGQVYTWGKGEGYRLGHGSYEPLKIPKLVEGGLQGIYTHFKINGVKVIDLSLGVSHAIAVSSEGVLYAWGTHERAQISNPTPQPIQVFNPSFKANG
ncbi:unnamed protein product [Leptidea sinapis]|uniref:E3 ubiquitin-protein ligase HERC2 n=1 Tax=Leptidea sinapis TaxID=189913 RepID=A0A5E4QY55_9NEOP|nr:unnamed protein product [Leptidea sinapis]